MDPLFTYILLEVFYFNWEIETIDVERYQWTMIVHSCYFVVAIVVSGSGDDGSVCVFLLFILVIWIILFYVLHKARIQVIFSDWSFF